jgi:hypothetical protein
MMEVRMPPITAAMVGETGWSGEAAKPAPEEPPQPGWPNQGTDPAIHAKPQPAKEPPMQNAGVPRQTVGEPPPASSSARPAYPPQPVRPGPGGYSPAPRTIGGIAAGETKGWAPRG